jgi:hypothetical protein
LRKCGSAGVLATPNAMKHTYSSRVDLPSPSGTREHARTLIVLLLLGCLLAGFAGGAFWLHRRSAAQEPDAGPHAATSVSIGRLSDGTRSVLANLPQPVEIRYYALLDPSTTPETLQAFAGRVDRLLGLYEETAAGRLKVSRHDTLSEANADAASFDGLRPFDLDKPTVSFLGLVVVSGENKELMPRLSQHWEEALESDLSRMVERVGHARKTDQTGLPTPARTDPTTTKELKRLIPNLGSISLDEGMQILNDATQKDLAKAVQETEERLRAARERLGGARPDNPSAAEQEAAMKEIQKIQFEQSERIKQIAQRLQDQLAALEYLKRSGPSSESR